MSKEDDHRGCIPIIESLPDDHWILNLDKTLSEIQNKSDEEMAIYLHLSLEEYYDLLSRAVENVERETERINRSIIDNKLKKDNR
jgi:hypothetical protein